MKYLFSILAVLIFSQALIAQSIGIGTTTPNPSAQLDVTSTNKGMLLPRMTLAQRNLIAAPAAGLLVYQTDNTPGFYYYNGASWIQFSTGSATNYWTANGTHIYSNNTGNIGIGVNPPAYKLDIDGRIRIRTGTLGNPSTSSGIWLEDNRDGTNRIFFGMQDSIHVGFYGAAVGDVGWDFNFNAKNGNVGIGIDNPADKLAVKGEVRIESATNSAGSVLRMYGGTNDLSLIQFYKDISSPVSMGYFGYHSGSDLSVWNSGTSAFLSSGGLGINIVSPAAKLHVNGNVMIGSGTPAAGYLLSVNGKMISEEVRVELDGDWPDYVFEKDYRLPSLKQLEEFIQQKKHLPNIPAAAQVEKDGIHLGDMNRRLLEKIEELTLYIIQQDKKTELLQQQVNSLLADKIRK